MEKHLLRIAALLAAGPPAPALPPPAERRRLREAWSVPVETMADTLGLEVQDMHGLEAGTLAVEMPMQRCYWALLEGMRTRLPAAYEPDWAALRPTATNPAPVAGGTERGACEAAATTRVAGQRLHGDGTCPPPLAVSGAGTATGSARLNSGGPAAQSPGLPPQNTAFPRGPLAVIGLDVAGEKLLARIGGGTVLTGVPGDLPGLLSWAHNQGFGKRSLHTAAPHMDPLLVLTALPPTPWACPRKTKPPIRRPCPLAIPHSPP